MKGKNGEIIYVGKAVNLKKRVASYFSRQEAHGAKTAILVSQIEEIETVVTATEKEALILESNLIKRHRPRYNVVLKDDKRYPSLRINRKNIFPKIEIVRKTPKDGALYFGPFSSAHAVRQTVKFINKTFPLRKCSDRTLANRHRPCIHHQMHQCLAPCCLGVDPKAYQEVIKEVILFLKGRTPELIKRTRLRMYEASEREDFETAAKLRDRMIALEKTVERQVSITTDFIDRDVLGLSGNSDFRIVTVMTLRRGVLQGVRHFELIHAAPEGGELIAQFMGQYYLRSQKIPAEIFVPNLPENVAMIEDALSEKKKKRVRIHLPVRGEKRRLLDMAAVNSQNVLRERLQKATAESQILDGLRKKLCMDRLPKRIECFDNSNLSGTNPVSAMVVFIDGRPYKAGYRKYAIQSVHSPDDYASMAEVLTRRYKKIDDRNPQPDLLLVDGGKGQVNIAISVLEKIGVNGRFTVAGIAKKDEKKQETDDKIYLPKRANPVNFGFDGRLLLMLQQIRDEAHRFAITYQRKRRTKKTVQSVLDRVPGGRTETKSCLAETFREYKKNPGSHHRRAQ
jgi:excinuclease ABC subunit C